jgi:hypothetical protein
MADARRRFTRQIRLSEVGDEGQARLAAAHVGLGGVGFARTIEERYLRGAGIDPTGTVAPPRQLDVGALGLRHSEARDVAEGALHALDTFRSLLGLRG